MFMDMASSRATKRGIAISLVLVCALFLAACETIQPAPHAPPPDPQTQMQPLERRIEQLVDSERQKSSPDAKVLVLDSELVGVARQRSEDMAKANTMAQRNTDGQSAADIIMGEDAAFQGMLGENVAAYHFNKEEGVDVEKIATELVHNWMQSPEHRDNLTFRHYDRTGVGAAVNADTVFVTQLFATNLGLTPPKDLFGPTPPDADKTDPANTVPSPKPRPSLAD